MKRSTMIVVIVILAIMLIGLVLVATLPNLNIGGQQQTEPGQTDAAKESQSATEETAGTVGAPEVETNPEVPDVQLPFMPFEDPTEEEPAPSNPGNVNADDPEPTTPGSTSEDPAPTEAPTEPAETVPPETMPGGETYPPNMTPLF